VDREAISKIAEELFIEKMMNNMDSTMIFMYIKQLEEARQKALDFVGSKEMYSLSFDEECKRLEDILNFKYNGDKNG
jgi:hypothetical protein